MREKTYRARLCLVQIATPDEIYLIDPLASPDLQGIADLIADPSIEVIVHAGRQDLEIFSERYSIVPHSIYDVQLAAGFAGYGSSLPYGRLVELATGEKLEKGESYTDWCRRPLTASQLKYAGDDVRYLIAIADRLGRELESQGRSMWVAEEMDAMEDPAAYTNDPGEVWRRVTGRGGLSGSQTSVLKEVARWREEEAARRDIPRGWVVRDPTLIEIARRAPASVEALKGLRGMNAKEVERSGRGILAAVKAGKDAPPMKAPAAPPRAAQVRARVLAGLADAIVRARAEEAHIATELVATRGEIEALLIDVISGQLTEGDHKILIGWRRDLAGDAVVDLARGKIGVRATDHPPYVEEIAL